jgi:hypothetical protein
MSGIVTALASAQRGHGTWGYKCLFDSGIIHRYSKKKVRCCSTATDYTALYSKSECRVKADSACSNFVLYYWSVELINFSQCRASRNLFYSYEICCTILCSICSILSVLCCIIYWRIYFSYISNLHSYIKTYNRNINPAVE